MQVHTPYVMVWCCAGGDSGLRRCVRRCPCGKAEALGCTKLSSMQRRCRNGWLGKKRDNERHTQRNGTVGAQSQPHTHARARTHARMHACTHTNVVNQPTNQPSTPVKDELTLNCRSVFCPANLNHPTTFFNCQPPLSPHLSNYWHFSCCEFC